MSDEIWHSRFGDIYEGDIIGCRVVSEPFEPYYSRLTNLKYMPDERFISVEMNHGPYFIQTRIPFDAVLKIADFIRDLENDVFMKLFMKSECREMWE